MSDKVYSAYCVIGSMVGAMLIIIIALLRSVI